MQLKSETKEKIEADIASWGYLAELPSTLFGFELSRATQIVDDVYEIFRYEKKSCERSVIAYYHQETKEYKLRRCVGLTSYCLYACIAPELNVFEKLLRKNLTTILEEMDNYQPQSVSSLVQKKDLEHWVYGRTLPQEIQGFTLFIHPREPVPLTNGSYILLDYSDFAIRSNFTIMYNIFRDDYFGEARILDVPEPTYEFDTNTLEGLESLLSNKLVSKLQEIRKKAQR